MGRVVHAWFAPRSPQITWAGFLPFGRQVGSEGKPQAELNSAIDRRRAANHTEPGAVYVLVADEKCGVIQKIEEGGLKFQRLSFLDTGFLGNTEIPIVISRLAESITRQIADRPRVRVAKSA